MITSWTLSILSQKPYKGSCTSPMRKLMTLLFDPERLNFTIKIHFLSVEARKDKATKQIKSNNKTGMNS